MFKPKTLTFAVGQWQKYLTISVLPDVVLEGNKTVNIVLSNPSSGLVIARTTGVLTIVNDDEV